MSNVIHIDEVDNKCGQSINIHVMDAERGQQGEQGPKGDAATITAGQAYSVPATVGPQVINTGTDHDAVFDFYIPRGDVTWGDISGNITNQEDLKAYLDKADSAIQPEDIDYDVMQDLSVSANGSTSVLQLDADKINLKTGLTNTKNIPLTVASHEKAGVMNSATFDAVANNSNAVDAILSGMVAINGLPPSPSQAELTASWEAATGRTELINRAQILDVDNSKYWTYYNNTETWYPATADIEGSVSTFTNATEGTIKGSTTVGQVYAESNGTGSVNGWDTLSAQVADNTANKLKITNLTASNGITATTTGTGGDRVVNLGFADKAVNNKITTNRNLTPTADTPSAWKALFGNTDGVYWTMYDTANIFTNQPNRWGFLETVIWSSEVYQRWHTQAGGGEFYRSGNATGWYGGTGNSGAFRALCGSGQTGTGFSKSEWVTLWNYYSTSPSSTEDINVVSKNGNLYTAQIINYNTGGCVTYGGSRITKVRGGGLAVSTSRPAQISFRGCSGSADIHGITSNTFIVNAPGTPNRFTLTANNAIFSKALTISPQEGHTTLSYTFTAQRGPNNYWLMDIDFMTRGSETVSHISVRPQAGRGGEALAEVLPGLYIPNTTQFTPTLASSWYEIYEPAP